MKKATGFEVKISLGNDAMRTHEDVAKALGEVARRLRRGAQHGKVMDENGNSVGTFEFTAG